MNRSLEGFDVNGFVREATPRWSRLEALLQAGEQSGAAMSLDAAREFAKLYRAASSDLILARTQRVDASIVDYLNALVARAYATVYGTRAKRGRGFRRVWDFVVRTFPRTFRHEWVAILLSATLFFVGAGVGALGTALDPSSRAVLIPEQHQAWTPEERVARDEGQLASAQQQATFSSFLFTHNIKVTFLAFALGISFGIGTALVLFYNGVPLGALAVQYHLAGQGLFFWAWILPHGIPELTQIFIAGAAGLLLGRGLIRPGPLSRAEALRREARRAVILVVGGMPILVVAGLIEGTISQIHEPNLPYLVKLLFAALVGVALYAYLLLAGANMGFSPRSDGRGGSGAR